MQFLLVAQKSHDEQMGALVEQTAASRVLMDVLTQRTIQAMDAITRLSRIVGIHEDRLEGLEGN